MQNLKITLIQTDNNWHDTDANLSMFEKKISEINTSTDVILLPEMFNTGFSMETELLAEPMEGKTFLWMMNKASETGALIIGSIIVKENDNHYNRLIWMEPNGSYAIYDKRHLFRMADEDQYYTMGNELFIKEWKGWKICPLVCYDLRFPVWSRNHEREDSQLAYDLLIYIANWPQARSKAWDILLGARAVENQCYCVGVNRIGIDGLGIAYNGHSSLYNAKGEVLFFNEDEEIIHTEELNYDSLQQYRKKFPVHLDADKFSID